MSEKLTYGQLEERIRTLESSLEKYQQENKTLQLNKDQIQFISDASPAFMAYVDADDLCYKFVNHQFEVSFNLSREKIIDRHIKEIIGQANYEFALPYIEKVRSGESVSYENIFNLEEGKRWVRVNYVPDFDEQRNLRGIVVLSYDITERKQAEESLLYREQLLNEMGDIAKIGGWEHDLITGKANWTEATYRIVDLEPGGAIPGMEEHLTYYPPRDQKLLSKAYNRSVETGDPFDVELQATTAKGRLIWVRVAGQPEYRDDNCIRMKGIIQDITEQKKMEEQLRQAQKLESIGSLAGGIAHDFNNILFPIVGMAELLMEDLPNNSAEYQNAEYIFKAGNRAGDLVRQILAFSRQSEHKKIPVQIQKVIQEVIKLCRATIPSNIELVHDIQNDCGMTIADSTQIHQVAMNLITNAYHAVEENGGKITIQLKEIELDFYNTTGLLLTPGRYAELKISDTGQGIDSAILGKIFDPYFTTKKHGKGTGFGLSTVYGIIKNHGGDIQVFTETGKGSVFTVLLPLMEQRTENIQNDVHLSDQPGTEHILIVDDEEAIARLEKVILERLGYKVTSCTLSTEALKLFKKTPSDFDIVVTDMSMPVITGSQLAKELISIKSDIPIIICTGFSENIDEKKAEEIGVRGFLMKPVLKHELTQMIRKILDDVKWSKSGGPHSDSQDPHH